LEYVNNKNVLCKEQFGFGSKRSTEAAIYSLISETFIALNNKSKIRNIFGDFTKAFYCFNRGVLLSK
jgi:hypothetical protein